jgi:hypothetical protein
MQGEALLFWLLLFGFLVADNLVLIKPGQDVLRMDAKGLLSFHPDLRIDVARQEMLCLNPVNLLDRRVFSGSPASVLNWATYRLDCRKSRQIAQALRPLVFLGYSYLSVLLVAAVMSYKLGFELIVLPLLGMHVLTWCASSVVVIRLPKELQLDAWRLAGLALECLLVPAYLVNLNRILLRQHTVAIGSLELGLRAQRKCKDAGAAELMAYQLMNRVDEIKGRTEHPLEIEQLEALSKCLKS